MGPFPPKVAGRTLLRQKIQWSPAVVTKGNWSLEAWREWNPNVTPGLRSVVSGKRETLSNSNAPTCSSRARLCQVATA